jgi:RNA polymerase sigma-70 factor (ECF subfamily)
LADFVASADDPAATVSERDAVARAWRAIDRLPEDRRRALVLRFVEEMSTSEIAAVLGRSEGAVRVLIHRALRAVAQATDGRGDAS